jgi:protoporphyrinogen oxidase
MLAGFLGSVLREPFRRVRKKRQLVSGSVSPDQQPTLRHPVKDAHFNDTSVDNLIRLTLGPRIADSLISSMVHGIYATDSRILSVRSTFPAMWNAVRSRGSLLLGLLLPRKTLSADERDAASTETQAWEAIGELNEQRKTWSVYGIKGGIETVTQKLVKEIKSMGVDLRSNQAIEQIRPVEGGCQVRYFERSSTKNREDLANPPTDTDSSC